MILTLMFLIGSRYVGYDVPGEYPSLHACMAAAMQAMSAKSEYRREGMNVTAAGCRANKEEVERG